MNVLESLSEDGRPLLRSIDQSDRDQASGHPQDLVKIFTETVQGLVRSSPRTARPNVSNINTLMSVFDPETTRIDEWLRKVDEWSQVFGWSEQETACYALQQLRGAAKVWYDGLSSIVRSWPEWQCLLRETFLPVRDMHTLLQNLLFYTADCANSYYEYTFRKLAMINNLKLNFDELDIINLIMGGINDSQIKFSVKTANITNAGQLASYLKMFDRVKSPSNSRLTNNFRAPENHNNASVVSTTAVCYHCKHRGHKRRFCPYYNLNHKNRTDVSTNFPRSSSPHRLTTSPNSSPTKLRALEI